MSDDTKAGVAKHANKFAHGLSATALVFLYANFPTKDEFRREVDKEHQRCVESQAKQWRDLMDFYVALNGH